MIIGVKVYFGVLFLEKKKKQFKCLRKYSVV